MQVILQTKMLEYLVIHISFFIYVYMDYIADMKRQIYPIHYEKYYIKQNMIFLIMYRVDLTFHVGYIIHIYINEKTDVNYQIF